METKLYVFLIMLSFAAKQNKNVAESVGGYGENVNEHDAEREIFVKIEEDEYAKINKKETSSQYIGVSYDVNTSKWHVQRRSKHEKKDVYNGSYDNEELAAHASDTLARKFMANGEQNHKLNFPDDDIEVYPEKKESSSQYIGVSYDVKTSKWYAQRHSKHEKKLAYNGSYDNEETAAHASDTLARKLTENGEQGHKLNFPDDEIEVYPEEKKFSSQYIGVNYNEKTSKWRSYTHRKYGKKMVYNGYYDNEEKAAHASDTLARKLTENGERNHKLNFPDDEIEVYPEEKITSSQYIGVSYNVNTSKWNVQRRSKHEKKIVYNGLYDNEETAAYASDTLARNLITNGEKNHKLNFPDDDTEVYQQERQRKRKRPDHEVLGDPKNN